MDELPSQPPRGGPQRDDGLGLGPDNGGRQPIFNMPAPIVASLALLTLIYLVQTYVLSPAASQSFVVAFGFSPVRYAYPLSEQGLEWLWTPLTYSFLHGGVEHLVFNGLWLAAFGTPVLRRIGTFRFALLWLTSAVAGALLHAAVNWGQPTLMIGASAVVSALMGAACRFAFVKPTRFEAVLPGAHVRRLSVLEALRQRTVLVFTAAWLFGNLAIAVGLPLFGDIGQAVAWDAHIGGFLLGFLGFALFDPARRPSVPQ